MAFGDLMWANFPAPTSPEDHVQAGARPAVMLGDVLVIVDADGSMPSTRTIVPMSRHIETLRFPATVRVEPSETNGLQQPSVILGFGVTTVNAARVGGMIGRLDDDTIAKLKVALRAYLHLD